MFHSILIIIQFKFQLFTLADDANSHSFRTRQSYYKVFVHSVGGSSRVESSRSRLHLIRVLTGVGRCTTEIGYRNGVERDGRRRRTTTMTDLNRYWTYHHHRPRLASFSAWEPFLCSFLWDCSCFLLSEWALNSSCITILTSSAIFRPSCCCCCNFYNSRREGGQW